MKAGFFVLLFVFGYIECRKVYAPIDKNANIAFINMEGGGGSKPAPSVQPTKPTASNVQSVNPAPASPVKTPPSPTPTIKPASVTPAPVKPSASVAAPTVKPTPTPVKPSATQIKPNPVTTPGPGSVKQLVNFYDSQGKASVIRPYSYSQAVKQG